MPATLQFDEGSSVEQQPPELTDVGALEMLDLQVRARPLAADPKPCPAQRTGPTAWQGADQGLRCECEKVTCNCIRRCSCSVSQPGVQEAGASSLLQLQEALADPDSAAQWESVFLQTGEAKQTLDCDCEQIKCNCLKACQCAVSSAGISLLETSSAPAAEPQPQRMSVSVRPGGDAGSPPARKVGALLAPDAATCSVSVSVSGASGAMADDIHYRHDLQRQTSCFSAPAAVSVSGDDAGSVVVWDTETGICGEGELYVHYVPGQSAAAMTAGAGALKHTYTACAFDTLPVSGTGCQIFSGTGCRSDCETKQWEVARAGTSC